MEPEETVTVNELLEVAESLRRPTLAQSNLCREVMPRRLPASLVGRVNSLESAGDEAKPEVVYVPDNLDDKMKELKDLVDNQGYTVYIEAVTKEMCSKVQDKLHDAGIFWGGGDRNCIRDRECSFTIKRRFNFDAMGATSISYSGDFYTRRTSLEPKSIIINAKDFLDDTYSLKPFVYEEPKHTLSIRYHTLQKLEDIVYTTLGSDAKKAFTYEVKESNSFDKYSVAKVLSNSKLGTSMEVYDSNGIGGRPKKGNFITNEVDGSLYLNKYSSTLCESTSMFGGTLTDINYTVNEDKANHIKIGKILNAINMSPQGLTSTEIEKITSEWKKQYTVDTDIVKVSEDIASVYDMKHTSNGDLGGSCMRGQGYKMEVYEDLKCTIAYILAESTEETLRARAIVWNEVEDADGNSLVLHDRIFASDENARLTLEKYFKDNNIDSIKNHSVATKLTLKGKFYDELPYIDNMYSLDREYRLNNRGHDRYGYIQSTEGAYSQNGGEAIGYTEGSYCECCDERYSEDELTYVEGYGSVCECCLDEYFVYCEDINNYVHHNDTYYTCEISGNHYESTDSLVYCVDIDDYVHENYIDDLYYCEDQEEYHRNRPFMSADGHYVADENSCYYIEEVDEYYFEETNYLEKLEELEEEREN